MNINHFKNLINFKKNSLLLFVGIVAAVVGIAIAGTEILLSESIPDDFLLKADKSKIIDSTDVNWMETDRDGNIINHGLIKKYAYIGSEVPIATYQGVQEDVSKRLKNVQRFKTKDFIDPDTGQRVEEWHDKVYVGTAFYYIPDLAKWFYVEHATTTIEAFEAQTKSTTIWEKFVIGEQAFALATTVYSGAGDGYVQGNPGSTDWDTVHNATDGNTADYTGANSLSIKTGKGSIGYSIIDRAFVPFDTSYLDDQAVISTSTLYIYINYIENGDNDDYDYIAVIATTTQASTAILDTPDYDQCGATHNPSIISATTTANISDLTNNQYRALEFTPIGLAQVSKTGWTRFGIREGHDIIDSAYSGANSSYNQVLAYQSEETGTSKDPYLSITYTVAPIKVRKPTDEPRNNVANTFRDGDLVLGLNANKTYIIDGVIFASSTSVLPDIKIAFHIPNEATMDLGFIAASDTFRYAEMLESTSTESIIPLTANTPVVIQVGGTVKTGNVVGNLELWWAQANQNPNYNTAVAEGSYLKAELIE